MECGPALRNPLCPGKDSIGNIRCVSPNIIRQGARLPVEGVSQSGEEFGSICATSGCHAKGLDEKYFDGRKPADQLSHFVVHATILACCS